MTSCELRGAAGQNMDQGYIDQLLERYLALLDEYTTLRAELGRVQAGMYQNIARANFSAERGMRYGQDFYDDRMQASRAISVSLGDGGVPRFELAELASAETAKTEEATADEKEDRLPAAKKMDPLRWFGILAPMPLRQAQNLSVELVERTIPRLASVNAEMAELEIQIRRARKKRAKAEAVHGKGETVQMQSAGVMASTGTS